MNDTHAPEQRVVGRTFAAEAVRSLAAGVLETALATFAIFIAVTHFNSGPMVKATILASQSLGLVGGLFLIPWIMRRGFRPNRAAACVHLLSSLAYALAAWGADREWCFVAGTSLGIGVIGIAIPLQTHYLRQNYPGRTRGRLFSATIVIRGITAMLASWLFGLYLEADPARYPHLLWGFSAAALAAAASQWTIPRAPGDSAGKAGRDPPPAPPAAAPDKRRPAVAAAPDKRRPAVAAAPESGQRTPLFHAMRWLRLDPVFGRVILAFMLMGMGVLSANALRVDYLVNPAHGLELDVVTVSLITGIVPSVGRIVSTFFWGWLFDQVNFFRLRLVINAVFFAGIVFYFSWSDPRFILVGSALLGLGRGGGEILFNLFVTRLAAPEKIAEYMTVHTFFAGLRMLAAPFLGFLIVKYASIPAMMATSLVFILTTFAVLWPLLPGGKRDARSSVS